MTFFRQEDGTDKTAQRFPEIFFQCTNVSSG
jgi:hypothetical protein